MPRKKLLAFSGLDKASTISPKPIVPLGCFYGGNSSNVAMRGRKLTYDAYSCDQYRGIL